MDKSKIEAQRKKVIKYLDNIVSEAKQIQDIMDAVPHQNGPVHRSLKNKSGAYIISSKEGFRVKYQAKDGNWYEIAVYNRNKEHHK